MNTHISLLSFLIACGGESVIEKQQNTAPTIMIGSHSPDAEILEGYAETFRASVSDDNNTYEELTVAWYVGENLVCDWETVSPAGESFCDITFDADDASVIAEVRDPEGAGGRTEISVVVVPTSAPTAEITNPVQNTNHYSDQLILFEGIVGDNEDDSEDLIVTWTSSLDGELILDTTPDSSGVVSDYGYLTEGQHALELRVEDSSGKTTREQLVIQVGSANASPTCDITSPSNQSSFVFGDEVIFEGTAQDANIDTTELEVVFSSDRDGELGFGNLASNGSVTYITNNLSNNAHVITMTVRDEVGATCQATTIVHIGTPPEVTINQPQNGELFSLGDNIFFNASMLDNEDQMSDLSVEWSSSMDGSLSTGSPTSQGTYQFTTDQLAAGVHYISVSTTDSTGLVSTDMINIQINTPPNAPTLTLTPDPLTGSDVLTVNVTSGGDADGDPVTHLVEWFKNGVLQTNTGNSIPSTDLNVGDVWMVRVTPNDGYTDGTPSESTIVVSNSLPTLTTPVISSSGGSVYNDSTLTCSATAYDADQTITPIYSWSINGSTYNGGTLDLSTISASAGDQVECTATVTDNQGATISDSIGTTVDNRTPTISSVTLTPSNPNTQDTLTCQLTASDPDGDALTVSYEWYLSGTLVGSGSTLDLSSVGAITGDTVECNVSVADTSGVSDTQSTSITLINSSPVFDTPATITPSVVEIGTNVTCTSVASDPDDGVASLSYIWNINGSQVATGSTWTVNSTDANVGDDLSCTALAVDYTGNTTASTSSVVTISNTAPTVSNVALDNTSPYTNDSITVSGTTFDFNGDTVTLQYEWHVIDASQGGQDLIVYAGSGTTFATLDGSQSYGFDRDDEVYAIVTPNDGSDNGASVESDHAIVLNAAPTAPAVSVTSSVTPPLEGVDDLTCMITTVSTDPDGDSIDYTFKWYDASGTNTQTLANTTNTVDIVSGALTTTGLWECDVMASDGSLTSNGFADIEVDSEWGGTLNFTNCGHTGAYGPSQSQCDTEYTGTTLDTLVTLNSGIQTYTIPSDGTYRIHVAGAAGGGSGGNGAAMIGEFSLSTDDELSIVVGQMGTGIQTLAGGGGGTFVWLDPQSPQLLIAAGGGGGGGAMQNLGLVGGTTSTTGNAGGEGNGWSPGNGGAGGANGSGGTGGTGGNSGINTGGGGGWLSNGSPSTAGGKGGMSFIGGHASNSEPGGFGGGGGPYYGSSNRASGGGGGYSGGGGGGWGSSSDYRGASGGGGGSYNTGTNQTNTSSSNSSHGYVIIDRL